MFTYNIAIARQGAHLPIADAFCLPETEIISWGGDFYWGGGYFGGQGIFWIVFGSGLLDFF